jgi:hypothetical protein
MDTSRKALSCSVDSSEETAEEAAVQRGLKSGGARTVCCVEKNSGQRAADGPVASRATPKRKWCPRVYLGSLEVL